MLAPQDPAWFALTGFILVLTPGPNMIYCISRTLAQGRSAGLDSLAGALLGFVVHPGAIQIAVSGTVNAPVITCAGGITAILLQSAGWLRAQRLILGSVPAALALRIAFTERK
ncbi:hypothetical protein BH11PSE7_BH11PSE7_36090 [soil metagenome]